LQILQKFLQIFSKIFAKILQKFSIFENLISKIEIKFSKLKIYFQLILKIKFSKWP